MQFHLLVPFLFFLLNFNYKVAGKNFTEKKSSSLHLAINTRNFEFFEDPSLDTSRSILTLLNCIRFKNTGNPNDSNVKNCRGTMHSQSKVDNSSIVFELFNCQDHKCADEVFCDFVESGLKKYKSMMYFQGLNVTLQLDCVHEKVIIEGHQKQVFRENRIYQKKVTLVLIFKYVKLFYSFFFFFFFFGS
ncbi:hypothetical protein HMI54_008532 [Coelomomyces lativittatus]|nr:hypothetical protein HMI54_008532 [Coelomomyces lativittatus]